MPSVGDRAVASYQAQQAHLYRGRVFPGDMTSLYLEQAPEGTSNPYSYKWPFSQAVSATLDLLGLESSYAANVQDCLDGGQPKYWDGTAYASYVVPPLGGGGDRYYDDNAWAGLNLVRGHRMLGKQSALDHARQVFEWITSGWDQDGADPAPGGVFWVDAGWNRDRNTCSNAPSAELGLRLHQATGQESYLVWARRMYDWVNATLLAPDGLYWDHIDRAGNIERTRWSYNQGTMIGAGTLLYEITGDGEYLARARNTAQAALELYGQSGYGTQSPAFNAIFFRNLLHLCRVEPALLRRVREAMQGYADDAWKNHRNPDGLFHFPAGSSTTRLLDQAALVQVHACLAWDPARYDLLV